MGRISLAQDDQWQAVLDVVQNLRFRRLVEIYRLSEELFVALQEELCCMELSSS
jgi:hypothetical protein